MDRREFLGAGVALGVAALTPRAGPGSARARHGRHRGPCRRRRPDEPPRRATDRHARRSPQHRGAARRAGDRRPRLGGRGDRARPGHAAGAPRPARVRAAALHGHRPGRAPRLRDRLGARRGRRGRSRSRPRRPPRRGGRARPPPHTRPGGPDAVGRARVLGRGARRRRRLRADAPTAAPPRPAAVPGPRRRLLAERRASVGDRGPRAADGRLRGGRRPPRAAARRRRRPAARHVRSPRRVRGQRRGAVAARARAGRRARACRGAHAAGLLQRAATRRPRPDAVAERRDADRARRVRSHALAGRVAPAAHDACVVG